LAYGSSNVGVWEIDFSFSPGTRTGKYQYKQAQQDDRQKQNIHSSGNPSVTHVSASQVVLSSPSKQH
jgi:hypothetical protein